jgi:subtilisin family serine protease
MGDKQMKSKLYAIFLAVCMTSLAGFTLNKKPLVTTLSINTEKISPHLLKKLAEEPFRGPVLVKMKAQADLSFATHLTTKIKKGRFVYDSLRVTALNSQKKFKSWLDFKKVQYRSFYIVNMVAIENATPELLAEISYRDDVSNIFGNPVVKQNLPKPQMKLFQEMEPGIGQNLISVGANRVWDEFGNRGQGIVVAGQDSGVDWQHPALKNQYRGNQNGTVDHNYHWHDAVHQKFAESTTPNQCGYELNAPCDDGEHGTHTMGTVVGTDGLENQIGMAPGAQWMACRNMDQGFGMPSTYIECFEFFLAPFAMNANPQTEGRPEMAPHVVNNSWGCPKSEGCTGDEILPALQAMKAAGIMVVVSAGNSGSRCETINDPPAYHTGNVLSVGAVDHRNGNIAPFSSRGPSSFDHEPGPHVTAPGVNVKSSTPRGQYAQFGWSGTSMAGPHVVGEVALMWAANPALIGQIDETAAIIKDTSTAKQSTETCGGVPGTSIPNNTYGFGIINAYDAVVRAMKK